MVTHSWSLHSVIHYSFHISDQAITTVAYFAESRTIMTKLAAKQPDASIGLYFYCSIRTYAYDLTLLGNNVNTITPVVSPCSLDLVPTDYHFFRGLNNFLHEKIFSSEAVQNYIATVLIIF